MEFKTWREGTVEMPGIHRVFGEINEYRSRKNLSVKIDDSTAQGIFYSFSEEKIKKFLEEHVCACYVGLIIEADSETSAIATVENDLGPIESIGINLITDENRAKIQKIMGDT